MEERKGVTLSKKKAELQTFLKLIATLWKQGLISGVCLRSLVIGTRRAQRTIVCTEREIIPNSFIDVVRQTENHFGQFGREQHRRFMEHLMDIESSLKVVGDPRNSES